MPGEVGHAMPRPRHAGLVLFHINSPLHDLQRDFPPFFAGNSLSSIALSESHFTLHCVPIGSEGPVLKLRHACPSPAPKTLKHALILFTVAVHSLSFLLVRPVSHIVAAAYPLLEVESSILTSLSQSMSIRRWSRDFFYHSRYLGLICIRFAWTWQMGAILDTHRNGCFGT